MTGDGAAGAAVDAEEAATVCGAEDAERKTKKAAAHTNTPIIRPAVNQKILAGRGVGGNASWARGAGAAGPHALVLGVNVGGATSHALLRAGRKRRGAKQAVRT